MPAPPHVSRRTKFRWGLHARTSSTSMAGHFPRTRRAFQVTRCNQCEDAPCVTACPTSAMFRRPDGIVDFDKEACIGCQGLHRRLSLRRHLHQPRGPFRGEVQLLCAPPGCGSGAGVRGGVSHGGDSGRGSRRPAGQGDADGARGRPHRPAPGEGDPPEALLQGRAPGDPGPVGGGSARGGALLVERAGKRRRPGDLRPPRMGQLFRRRDPELRRAPQRSLGRARQPLHLDQVDRGGSVPGTPAAHPLRGAVVDGPALALRRAAAGAGLSGGDHGPSDLGSGASRTLSLHPPASAVAKLAGARRIRAGGLRGRAGGPSGGGLGRCPRCRPRAGAGPESRWRR